MSGVMIFYGVLAILSLALWCFHPLLFELLDALAALLDMTTRDRTQTGAPVPLADDMETLRIEAAPSEAGTTRIVSKPVKPPVRLLRPAAESQREK